MKPGAQDTGGYRYQRDYSTERHDGVYNLERRRRKGLKIVAVLEDHFGARLEGLRGLDVGCSIGTISALVAERVRTLDGVDIDGEAIETAWREHRASNLRFAVGDAMALPYPEQSFDLVVCNHVYEHVPDTPRMFSEIRRVLKPGGICYLAAGNRLKIMEDHFHLPFLSIMPKPMANRVLHLLGKGDYYENLLTYWELRRLVGSFEVIDYTGRIIREPERFQATDMLTSRSLKQSLALAMLRLAYWAFPTYIWLLRTI